MSPTTWTVKDRPFRTNRYGERHVEQFIVLDVWSPRVMTRAIRIEKPPEITFVASQALRLITRRQVDIAYQSNESGRFEIYVQPFPGPGGKFQISRAQPRWNKNGKEIFLRIVGWQDDGRAGEVGARSAVARNRASGHTAIRRLGGRPTVSAQSCCRARRDVVHFPHRSMEAKKFPA
jgi:hypothetical protein